MLPKVELHLHLDGAIRFETLCDLAKKKSLPLPSYDPNTLKNFIVTREPAHLGHVLKAFDTFLPIICGDPEAIERVAYELCQVQAKQGVVYFEARFSPHFLANTEPNSTWHSGGPYKGQGEVGPEKVVQCVLRGLKRGLADFGVKSRVILCCISGYPAWSRENLSLCIKYKNEGVVAIDVAGCAHGCREEYEVDTLAVFEEAKKLGIRRTVHAGEAGTAKSVKNAIDILHAERIGHGYRVVNDEEIYKSVLKGGYHIEVCPLSSYVTGAVDKDWATHPARKFAQDKANFSISTDDPTLFDNCMESEFQICRDKLGFSDDILYQCQLNAARSAFLPDDEKELLLNKIRARWPKSN